MNDELLSISDAAERCGVHIDTLRKWERRGILLPEYTHGGHRRYRVSDIQKLQDSNNKVHMNYAVQAAKLRDERLQREEVERQVKEQQDKDMAEKQKMLQEEEAVKNKELLKVFQQFDKHAISNGEEKLEAGLASTTDGLQFVCLKLGSASLSKMHSWKELGAVLLSARYFAQEGLYLLRRYERRDQHNWKEIGRFKDVQGLMEAVVVEVAKL